MPEGDTVHKLANYLMPRLVGRLIQSGEALASTRVDLSGRRVVGLYARGKHLFIALDDSRLLRSHLGMWGSWHRYRVDEQWKKPGTQAKIVLTVEPDVYVCFNPKEVELLRSRAVRERRFRSTLGPDLLDETVDLQRILGRAREIAGSDTLVVDLLLDQRVASGIGNVYKSEVLFSEGVNPNRTLAELTDAAVVSLYERAQRLLRRNLGGGPRVTRESDKGGTRHWVYRRRHQPCLVCDAKIQEAPMGWDMRSTYWCPLCQRLPMPIKGPDDTDGQSRVVHD